MFSFYASSYTDEELAVLAEMWEQMRVSFAKDKCTNFANYCEGCKYTHICTAIEDTGIYINKAVAKRSAVI